MQSLNIEVQGSIRQDGAADVTDQLRGIHGEKQAGRKKMIKIFVSVACGMIAFITILAFSLYFLRPTAKTVTPTATTTTTMMTTTAKTVTPEVLPFRSPGGEPAPRKNSSNGTLMVITSCLSLNFEKRQKDVNRALKSVTESFSDTMREEFRPPEKAQRRTAIVHTPTKRDEDGFGVSKILLVNECLPENDGETFEKIKGALNSWIGTYGNEFNFQVVQKIQDCGQAGSLNLVLNALQDYQYWLHWEESWFVNPESTDVKKVWDLAYQTFLQYPKMGQIQFHQTDYNTGCSSELTEENLKCFKKGWLNPSSQDYIQLTPDDAMPGIFLLHTPNVKRKEWVKLTNMSDFWSVCHRGFCWPPFSLRPSLNLVDHALTAGYFDPDPAKRVVLFEQEYAMKWTFKSGSKWPPRDFGEHVWRSAAGPPIAMRDPDHEHTYQKTTTTTKGPDSWGAHAGKLDEIRIV